MAQIIINNFHKGLAQSPHLGFSDIRNADISSLYGVFKPNFSTAKVSGTLIDGEVNNIIIDPATSGTLWAVANGKVFTSTDGGDNWSLVSGNTTTGSAWNILVWKNYLLYFRQSSTTQMVVETYGPLSGTPAWTTNWQTLSAQDSGSLIIPVIHAQDDFVYFANGKYVNRLKTPFGTTFVPGTSSTYTMTEGALDLPAGYKIQTLTELSTQLILGTSFGPSFTGQVAALFPWDRTSPSFSLPTIISDFGVRSAITIGRTLYFFIGRRGRLFAYNGSDTREITRLPKRLFGFDSNPSVAVSIYPSAMTQNGDRLLFGVGSSSGTGGVYGVFSYNLITGAVNMEHKISTGTMTGATVIPSALQYIGGGQLLIGWKDATTYGIDKTSVSGVYTSYGTYFISKSYHVGTFDRPAEFSSLYLTLGKKLATGDGVRISWRETDSDNFTVLTDLSGNVFDYATYGARYSFGIPIKITAKLLQIKCEITTSGTSIPEVLEVRLL